jgi:hypothetical protein
MAKKVLLVVFTIECVVLAVLLCREWTVYYIGGGHAEAEYQSVYRDKIDAGHHAVTADIDAGTTSFVFWWGGTICIFFGVALGGPFWAYQQLWPERAALHAGGTAPAPWEALEERKDDDDGYVDDPFGDEYEGARAI